MPIVEILRDINRKQRVIDTPGEDSAYVERCRERRDYLLEVLKRAGFSVIFHTEVGRWMIYAEDRKA